MGGGGGQEKSHDEADTPPSSPEWSMCSRYSSIPVLCSPQEFWKGQGLIRLGGNSALLVKPQLMCILGSKEGPSYSKLSANTVDPH